MKLFKIYIRQQRKYIWVFLLFTAAFLVSFGLYHIPVQAVIYPALLCVLIAFLFFCIDFYRMEKKHRQLEKMQRMMAAMIQELPSVESIEDQDYQAIIRSLQNEVTELESKTGIRFQEIIEYYTMWAHQIKTPIAAMRLKIQQEDSSFSRQMASELNRIEQYVEMVLTFLRLDSDSSDYVFREHRIDSMVRMSVKKFASEFIDRHLTLKYEPIEGTVVTDEKWLSFVIEQILSNALKYTREGSIHIYLEKPMALCIADTGIGIAPEDIPRIFEKGFTGYNGRSDKKASGIGLYLCQRICRKLGIEISVDSKVDQGTIVRLDLEQYETGKE